MDVGFFNSQLLISRSFKLRVKDHEPVTDVRLVGGDEQDCV